MRGAFESAAPTGERVLRVTKLLALKCLKRGSHTLREFRPDPPKFAVFSLPLLGINLGWFLVPNELPNPHKITPKSVAVTIVYSSMLNFDFCNTSQAKCSFLLFQQISEPIQFHSELLFQCIRNLDRRNMAVYGSILMDFQPKREAENRTTFIFAPLGAFL